MLFWESFSRKNRHFDKKVKSKTQSYEMPLQYAESEKTGTCLLLISTLYYNYKLLINN